jgi:hypothetical protein
VCWGACLPILLAVSLCIVADAGLDNDRDQATPSLGVLLADLYNQGMPTSPNASPYVRRQRVAKHRAICGRCRDLVLL